MPDTALKADEVRRPTNVTLNERLVSEARSLGINISRACEEGLAQAIAATNAQRWKAENRAAIAYSNQYVEEHGIPFADKRQF